MESTAGHIQVMGTTSVWEGGVVTNTGQRPPKSPRKERFLHHTVNWSPFQASLNSGDSNFTLFKKFFFFGCQVQHAGILVS